ncbi:hypothetical protein [Corallococcus sicarius]|uniref:Uncharacterized protein n=1 Tax=Corallococcus sicarius TaxID=2316726 RepID=A0A3A8MPI4_9BACT|nr:hypothetical protein [Corallococcus sicarius]RKH30615.1 hypothetical protein D7X12_38965 [Corallococcus sicarius]
MRWLIALTMVVACVGDSYLRDGNGTYQVSVEQLPDGIVLVGIYAHTEMCDPNDTATDAGGLYAVDVRRGLIVAQQR